MDCDDCRDVLSARLDGEEEPGEPAAAHAHLSTCADCRSWLDGAATVTRLARTGPALPGIDVAGAVLPAAPGRWRARLVLVLRVALGAVGVAQLLLGVLQVSALRSPEVNDHQHGSSVGGATPGHLWHESAAWNVAVGVAFIWVATRRGRPAGIVPILTVFMVAMAVLSVVDMLAGQVELPRVASHSLVLAGYVIVLVLSRSGLEATPPGRRGRVRLARWASARAGGTAQSETVVPFPGRDRNQPAAQTRRRAAA